MFRRSKIWGVVIGSIALVLAAVPASQAQDGASCKFHLFQLPHSQPNGDQTFGVNRYGTVVGEASPDNKPVQGFTRSYAGDVKYLLAPDSTWSIFTGINDSGARAGNYIANGSNTAEGFMWKGSTFTPIVDPNSSSPYGTRANGINNQDIVVGYYGDSGGAYHSFQFNPRGKYITLDYPGGQFTQAAGINSTGTIVGSFADSAGEHGFIYRNGQWKKLDYPGTDGYTQVLGISDGGAVVGFTTSQEPYIYFLLEKGEFKVISDPKATGPTITKNIATNGLITGDVYLGNKAVWHGFIAACK
jgi:probable HAF family extracellular repeat protein